MMLLLCLAAAATAEGINVFKLSRWRTRGSPEACKEVMQQYLSVDAELNVLPYCTQYIPMDVIRQPRYQSICYHPSILPRHRGASAIHWFANSFLPFLAVAFISAMYSWQKPREGGKGGREEGGWER